MTNPKIGIRPVIDGRWGGVREELEQQTMGMAKSAQQLIEDNLRYLDGSPAECVIFPGTIGGGAEAAQCEEYFASRGVCATLTVTPCWCYGSDTMDMNPLTLKAVWGFNGTERSGAVYLAAVLAAHAQKNLPAFSIYGHNVQDKDDAEIPADVREKILRFARSVLAVGQMHNKAYVNLGGVSMGIAGSFCDPAFFQKYLGVRAEWVDLTEILRRIALNIYDPDEYKTVLGWISANCREGYDCNADKQISDLIRRSKVVPEDQDWAFIAKQTIICKDIMLGNPKLATLGWQEEALGRNAILGGFQGQRMWTDWLPNGDFMEAIFNSSFDWNGKRQPLTMATENDCLNGVAMLLSTLLTNSASVFADVRTYWSPEAVERVCGKKPQGIAKDGFIHLINSGAAALDGTGLCKDGDGNGCIKPWWDVTNSDIQAMLAATDWERANYQYFRGGGFSSHFSTQSEMAVTLVRLNLVDGIGPVLQIAEGFTALLDEEIHHTIDMRTDRTWPTTWFVPRLTGEGAFKDVYSVMANWGANHGAFAYGHIGADLITLASMLRIPVSLHNVPPECVYRPHAWSAFGMSAQEADYRACAHYGALYQ